MCLPQCRKLSRLYDEASRPGSTDPSAGSPGNSNPWDLRYGETYGPFHEKEPKLEQMDKWAIKNGDGKAGQRGKVESAPARKDPRWGDHMYRPKSWKDDYYKKHAEKEGMNWRSGHPAKPMQVRAGSRCGNGDRCYSNLDSLTSLTHSPPTPPKQQPPTHPPTPPTMFALRSQTSSHISPTSTGGTITWACAVPTPTGCRPTHEAHTMTSTLRYVINITVVD